MIYVSKYDGSPYLGSLSNQFIKDLEDALLEEERLRFNEYLKKKQEK